MKLYRFFGVAFFMVVGFTSCKKCAECTFSYTTTTTEFTPQGENTYVDTVENQALPNDDGIAETEICGKASEIDELKARYENGNSDGTYENYTYKCFEY